MSPPTSCLFCRIVAGEIPAKKVFETGQVLAFHDVSPQAPTHLLVIPKVHVDSLSELTDRELAADLMLGAQRAAHEAGLEADGYRVVTNKGGHGGQSVKHLHLHVLGGRSLGWPPG
ncbi:MAG: histidine triad nucleotide-binding protein [Myxococcales bacterium]|nr:MAG: histidine triad nucleotide-binding protein [Myxococcales bacterium]